ncbi:YoaK family protein [Caulobacter soli]|uniref:YoaK family protein n=1 Tax=Caulobacter soli TaxID=2708539 RepID=UPI0013EB77F8|nr:YoaK family protein [Caulobacter soli]
MSGEAPGSVRTAALAAFTAGFVDTVGFVGLFGLFTAHVTGNFVLIGAAIVTHHTGIIAKLLALPTFIVAVAATSLFLRHCRRTGRPQVAPVLVAEAALLTAFMALGLTLGPFKGGDQPAAILVGLTGVLAMGVQNAAARTVFAHLSPTTVMTGNVTQIVLDLVSLTEGEISRADALARIRKMAPPVGAFALGAIAGGLGFAAVGFWCILAGIVAILAALLVNRPSGASV